MSSSDAGSLNSVRAMPWALDEFQLVQSFQFEGESHGIISSEAVGSDTAEEQSEDVDAVILAEHLRAVEEAHERGRREGEEEARALLLEEIAMAGRALNECITFIQENSACWLSNLEENVAALAVMVARHVVQRQIEADETLVSELSLRAMEQYPADEEITVRMNPKDLATCRPVLDEMIRSGELGATRSLRWMADAGIARGGCLTEGRERIVDGRIDTALERAYRMLAGIQA